MSVQFEGEKRRQVNSLRFIWHEQVLADAELRKFPTALALAGYVMHRFRVDLNSAEFSNNGAAEALNMDPRSVIRAKSKLVERGWIRLLSGAMRRSAGWSANRYSLSGGPDDLILDRHIASSLDEGDTGVSDG